MKIELRRLFTYPVLAEGRDDYRTCKFFAEAQPSTDADTTGNLIFAVKLSTDCAALNRLIARGDAEFLFHVECPATIYRQVFKHSVGEFFCTIPLTHVKDKLNCMAFIVLRRDVEKFSCADWNDEFDGLTFDLEAGNILAYQNFPPLTLAEDPNLFKNVGSIFSIYRRLDDDKPFEFDLTTQKIRIGLNSKDYALYRRYCENPSMQPILNAMIILPVLVAAFEELKLDLQDHESDAWFIALQAAYKRRNLNFVDLLETEDALTLAQAVMGSPITQALKSISIAFDDAAEDS